MLDRPTSGLDPAGTKDLRELFLSLNREKGTTMLISSHILSELHQVATDFIIINRGKILRELTHEELERERAAQNDTLDEYFLKLVAKAEGEHETANTRGFAKLSRNWLLLGILAVIAVFCVIVIGKRRGRFYGRTVVSDSVPEPAV